MWKSFRAAILGAFLLCSCAQVSAENLSIQGLGEIPFKENFTVSEGSGQMEQWIIKNVAVPTYGETKQAALDSVLFVPPGMNFFSKKAPYPFASLKLYQIHKKTTRGVFTANVYVFSGTEEELFQGRPKRDKEFWRKAFENTKERPTSLFGMPKISVEEFQHFLEEKVAEKKGKAMTVKILKMDPWQPLINQDGTYHWEQDTKAILTTDKGMSFPIWVNSFLFKNKDRYFIIEVRGSHASQQELGDELIYSVYQLEREKA